MYCHDCGKEIKDEANYCKYCGGKLIYTKKIIMS
jgi:rRNA maturation endonuclease Nob1